MSVKVHEAYSLDSFQDRLLWWDDFLGDQLQDEWSTTIVGAGTAAVVDAQTGGIVRLTTGALTNNSTILDWNDIRSLHVDQKVTMELRVKPNQLTQYYLYLELWEDNDNRIMFYSNNVGGADDWEGWCENNTVVTRIESGITVSAAYHVFRIECFPTDEVHFYIDGVETANSPITTNIPDDAADYLQPKISIITKEDVAKSVDIDYVVVRQEI